MNKRNIGIVIALILSLTCYSNAQNGDPEEDLGADDAPVDADDSEIVAEDQAWSTVSGGLKHVSTSINYYWGVNRLNQIFRCTRPCRGSWIRVPGGLAQVDVGDMEVWGVFTNHHIFKRSVDGAGSWIRVGGLLKHVSASGNGYIWGVNSADNIYKCKKPCNGRWSQVPGKLKQIDGGEKYVFGVNAANYVYRRAVDGSGVWIHIRNMRMTSVTVGADAVYGVSATDNMVYRCALPCNYPYRWTKVEGCQKLKQVEAAVGELVGTNTNHNIFRKDI